MFLSSKKQQRRIGPIETMLNSEEQPLQHPIKQDREHMEVNVALLQYSCSKSNYLTESLSNGRALKSQNHVLAKHVELMIEEMLLLNQKPL